jgi:hypothetical protein
VLLIVLLLQNASRLVSIGLDGKFYYFALLPLGLTVAGFLFGALRSYALYRGRRVGVMLYLIPFVGGTLAVIGGIKPPPSSAPLTLTVYVRGLSGPHELPLRNRNAVFLDLDALRRREPIGANGEAIFTEIHPRFLGQRVNVGIDAPGYELVDKGARRLEGASLYLTARRVAAHITGNLLDEAAQPVIGALVTVAGVTASSDSAGYFELIVPSEKVADDLPIQVVAAGFATLRSSAVPGSQPISLVLRR